MRCKCGNASFVQLEYKSEDKEHDESINEIAKFDTIKTIKCLRCDTKYNVVVNTSIKIKN